MDKIIKAKHKGELKIGDMLIPCAVLEDGTRVISEIGIYSNLGSGSGGKVRQLKEKMEKERKSPVPIFLASKALEPFIDEVFDNNHLEPIKYINNNKMMVGYDATILPKVCEVWLKAREEKVLQSSQLPKAQKAEILIRSLAKIGITALVDEATGYQYDRERFELQKILQAYISEEILKWQLTFTDEFYREVYRLWGLPFVPKYIKQKPSFIGGITTKYVYDMLPDGVVEKIRETTPKTTKGHWKYKFHQSLTQKVGREHLKKQIIETTLLMSISNTKEEFQKLFKNKHDKQIQLEFEFEEDDKILNKQKELSKYNKSLKKALDFNPNKKEHKQKNLF
jgi:hypothetical protein